MAWSEQRLALDNLRKKYGPTVFVKDHVHYKLVGIVKGAKRIFTVGNTWDEAMKRLARKAGQW
jgi:hypothetical protein